MAVITPQSDVYLLKCPLEIDNENQLTFANATAQHNYFNSLPKIGFNDFTYIRQDGVLRIPAVFDDIITYNYVMYRNDAYSNKWFYAYITGIEYKNDGVTDVSIATDTFQTWQFDLVYKPTLVEREHVNNDTIGAHTLPENVELGDYVCNGAVTNFGTPDTGTWGDYCLVVDVTMIENPGPNQTLTYSWVSGHSTPSLYVNGIPSGLYHLIIGYYSSVVISARDVIDIYDKAGLGDAIQNIYIVPKALIGSVEDGLSISTTGSAPTASVGGLCMPSFSQNATTIGTFTYTMPTTIRGYSPKNNKLFCAPYNFLNVSNNAGTVEPYKYEDFSSGVSFTVEGALAPSGSIKCKPNGYKNVSASENAYDYALNGAKYPMCAWASDSYTNWLTQNAVNMRTSAETGALTAIGSMAGGAVFGPLGLIGGAIAGGASLLSKAQNQYAQQSSANVVPDQAKGNLAAGDVVWAKLRSKFTFMPMSIKSEYAKCIDQYFSAFGYKINELKIPNITGRKNWNFVKTASCYIEADIPQEDLQQIKTMFDNGVTFWHNPSTFGDYSQSNTIVS